MERWEYLTALFRSDTDHDSEYIKERFPSYSFRRYNPIGLVPLLDDLGKSGWELISITPVVPREQEDVVISATEKHGAQNGKVGVHDRYLRKGRREESSACQMGE